MLLSLPTWIIHLLTVSEWFAAMLLFDRYGRAIGHRQLRLFALCMLPHLLGGLAILLFHVSGDRLDSSLALARALTFLGSLLLLAATLSMLPRRGARLTWLLVPAGLAWGLFQVATSAVGVSALLPSTNAFYLSFLVTLLFVYRADRRLFSPLTLFGFWFLLVFVIATLFSTQLAVERWSLPSLSHADALHGGSEALLSISNLMIALGVAQRLKRLKRTEQAPAQARAE